MRNRCLPKIYFFILVAVLFCCMPAIGHPRHQESRHITGNVDKVKDLVNFLQFTLNTIGNPRTTTREKDIIITQSYLKLFRDPKVQIEDDLDPNRQTVTNKDVQAYLKDVDFFFKSAHFSLDIQEIDSLKNDKDEKVYVVKLNRNLNAVTIDDDTLNQNITRYLEVNLNTKTEDLKIASYYSTKLSEDEDLGNWWQGLTFEWKLFFKNKFNLPDSVDPDNIRKIIHVDSVDISDNPYITSLAPLSKCEQLEYLDISNTYVNDLAPLRYLSKLRYVNIAGTKVNDISYLHYSMNLQDFNLSGSMVNDFDVITGFPALRSIDLGNTSFARVALLNHNRLLKRLVLANSKIISLDSLEDDNNITYLDISGTAIENLKALSGWKNLEELIFERTVIDDLSPMASLSNLRIVNCESTNVSDLSPLKGIRSLRKIYCDNSGVTKELASRFTAGRPDVLLIFESQELARWWAGLTAGWKDALLKAAGLTNAAGKDDLARIVNIDSLVISHIKEFRDLDPISDFTNLKYLDCSGTGISDLSAIEKLQDLRVLDIGNTMVSSLEVLHNFKKLTWLNIDDTQITDLSPLRELRALRVLVGDHTAVPDEQYREIATQNPAATVIYRTDSLKAWWSDLSDRWKSVFMENVGGKPANPVDKWYLHKVGRLEKLRIDSAGITNLKPLNKLVFLRTLTVENTPLSDISTLAGLPDLQSLKINRCPVTDFSPLDRCGGLTELDLSNTGLEDMEALKNLTGLKKLLLSGTRIRKIREVESMTLLTQLDISNTKVNNLKPLYYLYDLKTLTCFNTRISSRHIEAFKEMSPSCEVIYY